MSVNANEEVDLILNMYSAIQKALKGEEADFLGFDNNGSLEREHYRCVKGIQRQNYPKLRMGTSFPSAHAPILRKYRKMLSVWKKTPLTIQEAKDLLGYPYNYVLLDKKEW